MLRQIADSTESAANCDYSPVRHMALSLFPSSDKIKLMAMLSAYMDETGHSKDELQLFNGMAGLVAPADAWIEFEGKWNQTITSKEFGIPYFHMREFEARHPKTGERIGFYKGWDETKRRRLYGKLLRHIHNLHPVPIGAMIAMEDWQALTDNQRQLLHGDPYFLVYQNVIAYSTTFIEMMVQRLRVKPDAAAQIKVQFVFSDQVEFRHRALMLYEEIYKVGQFIKRSAKPPAFDNMRDFAALQAADVVAYEMYKEYDRRKYRPTYPPRWAFPKLEDISRYFGHEIACRFYSRAELTEYAQDVERTARRKAYWDNKRAKSRGE